MDNPSSSFLVPLTLPTAAKLYTGNVDTIEDQSLVESGCLEAQVTVLVSWGLSGSEPGETRGVVMGCADGALYIFQPPLKARSIPKNPSHSHANSVVDVDTVSGPSTPSLQARRHSRSAYPGSRPVSPSLAFHQATFNITSRSRVVSGISKEQVEAPKNYVDFDDEPEKLKEMLKGKGSRDKAVADNLVPKGPVTKKSVLPPISLVTDSSSKRKDEARSLLSATTSPPFTPKSLSTPASPKLLLSASSDASPNPYALSLRCHILPPRPGPVSAVRLLDDNRLLIVLQNTGDISVFKTKDGACIATAQAMKFDVSPITSKTDGSAPENVWTWKRLCLLDARESTILLACAALDVASSAAPVEAESDDVQEQACMVMFELFWGDEQRFRGSKLDKLGQWSVEASVEGLGLYREIDNNISFFFVDPKGHFVTQGLRILPRIPLPSPEAQNSESSSHNLASLPLHIPFKAMKPKSSENLSLIPSVDTGRIAFDDKFDVGELFPQGNFVSSRTHASEGKLRGIIWTNQEILAFRYQDKSLRTSFTAPAQGVRDLSWIDENSYLVAFEDRCESYTLISADVNNEMTQSHTVHLPTTVRPQLVHRLATGQYQAMQAMSTSKVLATAIDKTDRREVKIITVDLEATREPRSQTRPLWKSTRKSKSVAAQLTSMLPLDLDLIIFGYDDGLIRRCSFAQSTERHSFPEFTSVSDVPLNASIVGLYLVQNERTKDQFFVGGSDDGCVAFWSKDSLELRARWTVFTTPLAHATQLRDENAGPLRGCVLCIAEDGTIAVIVIDGFQFLHLVPGSASSLQKVCIGGHNMLLIYTDGRVRLWDTQTTEFWRSTSVDKAEELLSQGGWTEISLTERNHPSGATPAILPNCYRGLDTRSTMLVDLEAFLSEATLGVKGISDEEKSLALHQLRTMLLTLLTPGLSEDIDCICREKLRVATPSVSTGLTSLGSTSLVATNNPLDLWCISPEFSAMRALSITAVLRALGLIEELSDDCNTVITFYATSLVQVVGNSYQSPSLAFLAWHWFRCSNELRQGARILFDAGIARLSDEETIVLVEQWQHDLPCLQPDAEKELIPAAMSLFLCGYMAAENYSLVSTSTLTDISKSIAMYLHDEKSLYRVLAIDLCSRGFHIWHHYIDAMEMLRALFNLATNSRKEYISTKNVGPQARLAVLQIAASNTPLFMTTLGLDILHPRNVEHRKSTMQLVAFLIRKRPLVLYPNLPRLMEAVVKSLDPNSTTSRDAVLDTATEILGHVVKTFPTVDFYMANQRLAVGTNEGAIVMYDLKTATRLYVLDGHRKRLAACSFSPDGRRLVTVSLEEGVVLVWKVGSSFSSFFNPGAPPRQGHGGSQPFKRLAFNVGDEANMTVGDTLEWVRFEWTAERSVKLKIREITLTFST